MSVRKRGEDPLQPTLPEAPTFHPTAKEFENPLRYILSIREEAERFGICCIAPPPSWKPPFMIDLNKLKFPTRVQKINELLVSLNSAFEVADSSATLLQLELSSSVRHLQQKAPALQPD